MTRRRMAALVAGVVLVPVVATAALAHPLGNFTINHYAGIRVEPDRILLDVVIDQAEIPTFQATMDLDADGDGEFSDVELGAAKLQWCGTVGEDLTLRVDSAPAPLRLIEAGITFPPGNGGLSTMRLVCTLESPLAAPLSGPVAVTFADAFERARIGWREITVVGSGVTVAGDHLVADSPSRRLTAYPSSLAAAPDVRSVTFTATPGGPVLAPFDVPDADPVQPVSVGGGSAASPSPAGTVGPSPSASSQAAAAAASTAPAAVPGGDAAIPDVLRALPVTPALALLALATAALLGAGHALTPGHGKTLMAAYLVGTRGSSRHALGLGAAVSVSHTLGILGLAMVVLAAESALPPDLVVRLAPVIAAFTIVGIGGWMLFTEARRWQARRALRPTGEDAHTHDHDHDAHAHGHEHDGLEHSHGGVTHRHVPTPGSTITWRSLFVLGLAGGLIPSTNALLILLATIAAGQPAWGVVLVVAFGLGMAAVMAGVGLAFVYARGLLERGAARAGVGRAARLVPLAAGVVVLTFGVVLTSQALVTAGLV
jgi:nickel/cobalt exporter